MYKMILLVNPWFMVPKLLIYGIDFFFFFFLLLSSSFQLFQFQPLKIISPA